MQAFHAQRQQTSQNASRPPSSDPPQPQRRRRPRSTRQRGGQPGHPGHTRPLRPVDAVDEVVVLQPTQCTGCAALLSGAAPTPWRHQVIERPPLKPVVTEYQGQQLVCPTCGAVTRAAWPAGVPRGTYGPRVPATVALCLGAYRLSTRLTQQMMDEVCGVPMSVGTISPWEPATTAAVAAPVEEARTGVPQQAVAHLAETSWRQGGKHAGLGVAVTRWVTVFVVRLSRGGPVARERLGETVAGILVTERYSAYNWYPVRWRQLCWAHGLRDGAALRDRGGQSQELGEALLAQAPQMLRWWHRVREGTVQRSTFRAYMSPLRRAVERFLAAGSRGGVPQTAGTCRDILKRREALGTCVQVDGVAPTNKAAERSLRPGVLWRTGSFGPPSAAGSRCGASMMTVVTTWQQQQRNIWEFLTAACEAALRGDAAPSLLPASAQKAQSAA